MSVVNEYVQTAQPVRSLWKTAVILFKLRVVSLLLFSAFGGAALGAMVVESVSLWSFGLLAVVGTLSAAGASAINQYLERDRDAKMNRTAKRPLATGEIQNPHNVLLIGSLMVFAAAGLALLADNLALAFWSLLGAVIYVGVYTMWLKPRTTINIVIGGAAGSCAVISGGAAVGAWSAWGVWILALLVFVWTPVHFWALALAYRKDYIKADYPMLPAKVPALRAAQWTAFHTVLTAVAGLALGFWPVIHWIYLIPITIATIILIIRTINLLKAPAERAPAFALFHFSNLYLALVLVFVVLASVVSI